MSSVEDEVGDGTDHCDADNISPRLRRCTDMVSNRSRLVGVIPSTRGLGSLLPLDRYLGPSLPLGQDNKMEELLDIDSRSNGGGSSLMRNLGCMDSTAFAIQPQLRAAIR